MTALATPPTTTTDPRRPARIGLIILGTVVGLLALVALAAGGALLWAHTTQRDGDGFYSTNTKTLTTSTYALASDGIDVGTDGPNWLFRKGRLATIRVTATGTGGQPVFVGIAKQSQIDSYLKGVAHDEITDFDVDPFTVTSKRRGGAATPAPPAGEKFWSGQVTGRGAQVLRWKVKKGNWSVVVMNADGTRGVQAGVKLGAKVPFVLWLGIGLLAVGLLLAAGAWAAIYSGVPRRTPPRGAAEV